MKDATMQKKKFFRSRSIGFSGLFRVMASQRKPALFGDAPNNPMLRSHTFSLMAGGPGFLRIYVGVADDYDKSFSADWVTVDEAREIVSVLQDAIAFAEEEPQQPTTQDALGVET